MEQQKCEKYPADKGLSSQHKEQLPARQKWLQCVSLLYALTRGTRQVI